MSTSPQSQRLRDTAASLRSLANKIGNSRALTVHRSAGTDTWVGPTPDRCYEALRTMKDQLQAQQSTLVDTARILERRADTLDTQLPIHGAI
jgi:phosphoglycolate phosphatase-like HAD superfamily hydrolase